MDDALVQNSSVFIVLPNPAVLILVLMDDALVHSYMNYLLSNFQMS